MTATATKRFSKQTMIEDLQAKIAKLEYDYGFSNFTGEAFLTKCHDSAKFAYGEYRAYCDLLEQIENGY